MMQQNLEEIAEKIEVIKSETIKLKNMSGGIQAIDRNVDRILASIKMLEINVNDLLDIY
jgi:hypothetical protein